MRAKEDALQHAKEQCQAMYAAVRELLLRSQQHTDDIGRLRRQVGQAVGLGRWDGAAPASEGERGELPG